MNLSPVVILSIVDKLLGIITDLVGMDNAKALLTADAVKRANAVADTLQWLRFKDAPKPIAPIP